MYCDYIYPFRIEKEVGLTVDGDGNNSEAYLCIRFNKAKRNMTEKEYNNHHKELVSDLAKQFRCEDKYIVPITGQEYEENAGDDE